jgi:choice-of-anchor B domain-containing protein
MKYLLLNIIFFISLNFIAQINIDSISHVNFVNIHDSYLNDVWGHLDDSGNEYALVGARKGTSIVSLQNPTNPVEVFWEPGIESIWRDINTYQNFAYVTTEADTGLLIINMNSLPNANGIVTNYYTGPANNTWTSAHTLFVDSSGYAYIFGANRGNGGVIILDVHTDPMNPIEVGTFDNWYAHDGYVLNDTMYLAHISDGFISIVDVTDKSNPILLGTKITTNSFSHNIWTNYDLTVAYTTDEVTGAFVGSYDISDPNNIQLLDIVQSSPGSGVIPHNVHFMKDFLIVSNYSDGVVIFDTKHPNNLIQVGNYDTYPGQTSGYDGCWASYPFLPSGLILAADITEGLFILNPTYVHASLLEGIVTDATTSQGLIDVKIEIQNSAHLDFSKNAGNYATGTNLNGAFQVTYSKTGYYPQTFTLNLLQNQVLIQDVSLIPIPQFDIKVIVKEFQTNNLLLDAQIELNGSLTSDLESTNGLGEAIFLLYYEENYEIIAGKWGYKTKCSTFEIDENTQTISIFLEKGYYDDFEFDFGWTAINNGAENGLWERGKPIITPTTSAPAEDANFDCGNKAFVTGNIPLITTGKNPINNGEVILKSPTFDLTSYQTPFIHYTRWFFDFHGPNPPDDTLKVYLSNGFSTVLIDKQSSDTNFFYKWVDVAINVNDYILPTANMTLTLKVSDYVETINIVEAGLDFFYIDNFSHLNLSNNDENIKITCFPNPVNDIITFLNVDNLLTWEIYDLNQKKINNGHFNEESKIDVSKLNSGIYFIKIQDKILKFVKN